MIIVTGLGRCGSSMVMQMLSAGGIQCAGTPPYFESSKAKVSSFDADWVSAQFGAVKVLALHRCKFKPGDYKVIYCYRDHRQQARSQKKFYENINSRPVKKFALASRIRKESPACLRASKKIGPVLSLKFEDFFDEHNLMKIIANLCIFLNLDPEVVSVPMYNCVISRPPECMPDMQIEEEML